MCKNLALLVFLPRANQCWLVAQYNCLEFKKFARIWLLKMLSFSCQKNPLSLSIILLLEVLYTEQPDDGFLNFFLLIKCASRIMVLLVPVNFMFIQESLVEGFVLKKNFSSYSYVEAALTTIVRRELSVYYVPLDFFAQSNSIHFWKP